MVPIRVSSQFIGNVTLLVELVYSQTVSLGSRFRQTTKCVAEIDTEVSFCHVKKKNRFK